MEEKGSRNNSEKHESTQSSKLRNIVAGRTRNYKKIYTDVIEEREREYEFKMNRKKLEKINNFDTLISRLRVNKMLYKYVKARLKTKFHSVRATIENMTECKYEPFKWGDYRGSQALCDICQRSALRQVLVCATCNVVYHSQCYQEYERQHSHHVNHDTATAAATAVAALSIDTTLSESNTKNTVDNIDENWVCLHCSESDRYEMAHQAKVLQYLKKKRFEEDVRKYLARIIYGYLSRKKFVQMKSGLTIAQSLFRAKMGRRYFVKQIRASLRVIVIEVQSLPSHFTTGWVTLTLIDPVKHYQIMRFDKDHEQVYKEGFLIPGMSLNVLAVFTLSDGNNVIMSQTKFYLKDRGISGVVGGFRHLELLKLGDSSYIMWPPQDVRDDDSCPRLTLPESENSSKKSKGKEKPGTSSSTRTALNSRPSTSDNVKYLVKYIPMSSLGSLCCYVLAPPLDVLRKPPDAFTSLIKGNQMSDRRSSRYWIVLCELTIYFFSAYAETKPRFVMPIGDSSVAWDIQEMKESHEQHAIRLTLADKRQYIFDFDDKLEASKFYFNITECQKYQDDRSSLYVKGSRHEDKVRPFYSV